MHCSRRLIIQTLVFNLSYLHRQVSPPETLVVKEELLGREMADEFCLKMPDFHLTFRDILHAVNLRHGTNGFTSLPKEGMLRIFPPWKIRRLRAGLNPRTWVPKASNATSRPPKPLNILLTTDIIHSQYPFQLLIFYCLSSRNSCSKWPPPESMHAWTRMIVDCCTLSKDPRRLWIVWQIYKMRCWIGSSFSIGAEYIRCYKCPHR